MFLVSFNTIKCTQLSLYHNLVITVVAQLKSLKKISIEFNLQTKQNEGLWGNKVF